MLSSVIDKRKSPVLRQKVYTGGLISEATTPPDEETSLLVKETGPREPKPTT
jgi:hypothetical protein